MWHVTSRMWEASLLTLLGCQLLVGINLLVSLCNEAMMQNTDGNCLGNHWWGLCRKTEHGYTWNQHPQFCTCSAAHTLCAPWVPCSCLSLWPLKSMIWFGEHVFVLDCLVCHKGIIQKLRISETQADLSKHYLCLKNCIRKQNWKKGLT